ncbi:MAG: bifunctional phosphopantothenoylcysteine decarboxylase/phosphopantothenate--cysteine ligase CoaBC [Bacteroidetes bacterium]|nr:bifunctional phosphopantothenoylcysteine decarboxylase/phosphopantothenate--cysteine ligase CoaBC [Bacteroidota bacterium]MBU1372604.1 bifunctional phosphopantothenoylcysteine decarboxylase/phosphopantothenate--cysteine ligase CoaBC [Bacteroidota bacterium]MBU1484800.1 bifunctional phosphopantothenoylcysteine decarboxylase/phosphopantothenate--cysteine ligase CoaBC [Bacteroidota bacterium]MBU1762027.1 bifunctional phosphopantothenoylcysteine decarboxylase/phosphopantothenate--cysteine ligase 
MLKDKNILLGVCGSIASYKSAELIRLLVKAGANVKVVMTKDATSFITPLTLATLSKNPVLTDYYKAETGEWNNHVELGLWADIMIVAPATANTLAKFAHGLCDNLLSATYLSAKCVVYLAPAMDLDMWKHEATQQNISKLIGFGNQIIKPRHGELASGLVGEGRLAEPQEIMEYLNDDLKKKLPLKNKKALVTAGPTHEAIDPVRFIGNHSSGKMGFAIAEELASLGADVTLISGPTGLETSKKSIKRINITSAAEMLNACLDLFHQADICVMSAAIADYTPAEVATQKIKKNTKEFSIELKKTQDVLFQLGKQKKTNQILVGFALETNNEEEFAKQKLQKKNLDFIVLNSMNDEGAGFKKDTNKISIIDKKLIKTTFDLKSKTEVAKDICAKIISIL